MSVNRIKEQVMVTRKDTVAEIVELNNGFNRLTRSFTFVKFSIDAVTLIVSKVPDGFNGVKDTRQGREKTRFINQPKEEIVHKVLVL